MCDRCVYGLVIANDGSCEDNNTTSNKNATCPSEKYASNLNLLQCNTCDVSCLTCYRGTSSDCFTCNIPSYTMTNGRCTSSCQSTQFSRNPPNIIVLVTMILTPIDVHIHGFMITLFLILLCSPCFHLVYYS